MFIQLQGVNIYPKIENFFIILKAFIKYFEMLFIYNSKETNVVHRTRMTIAKITGCHVVLGATETLVDVPHLTAQIQVSSPVKESLWLKIVKQFAIHVKV